MVWHAAIFKTIAVHIPAMDNYRAELVCSGHIIAAKTVAIIAPSNPSTHRYYYPLPSTNTISNNNIERHKYMF